jgi:hypothetical protein
VEILIWLNSVDYGLNAFRWFAGKMEAKPMQNHISRILGGLLLLVGVSVFLIRLQHAGPYAMPGGGNLIAGALALVYLSYFDPIIGPHYSESCSDLSFL